MQTPSGLQSMLLARGHHTSMQNQAPASSEHKVRKPLLYLANNSPCKLSEVIQPFKFFKGWLLHSTGDQNKGIPDIPLLFTFTSSSPAHS